MVHRIDSEIHQNILYRIEVVMAFMTTSTSLVMAIFGSVCHLEVWGSSPLSPLMTHAIIFQSYTLTFFTPSMTNIMGCHIMLSNGLLMKKNVSTINIRLSRKVFEKLSTCISRNLR